MKKYMLMFVGLENKPENMETEDYATRWQDWVTNLEKDSVVESSLPFEWSGKVVTGNEVADLELKETDIGGYMLIQVDSYDKALEIAKSAPHIGLGGSTIIRPCISNQS